MNDPQDPCQSLNYHLAPWVRNIKCSLLFLHPHPIWANWVNTVSFGTVLPVHSSDPKNAHTLWPFDSPQCWSWGLPVLQLIDWWHLQKPRGCNLCPVHPGCMTAQYKHNVGRFTSQVPYLVSARGMSSAFAWTYHHVHCISKHNLDTASLFDAHAIVHLIHSLCAAF